MKASRKSNGTGNDIDDRADRSGNQRGGNACMCSTGGNYSKCRRNGQQDCYDAKRF